jgi:chromosomal replication initiator protein
VTPLHESPLYGELFDGAVGDLEAALGRRRFRLWFRDVALERVVGRRVTLGVPTEVHRTWIEFNYASLLEKAFARVLGEGVVVELRVSQRLEDRRAVRDRLPADEASWTALLEERRPPPTLVSYVGDESARFVVHLLRQTVHGHGGRGSPTSITLWGESGSGKTHLLTALAREVEAQSPGAALYLPARRFTHRFVTAVRSRDPGAVQGLQADLEGRGLLLVDDLQDLVNKPATQHALDGLLERAERRGMRFVGAGRGSPRDLPGLSDRLRSRLLGGVVHRVRPPEAERRAEALSVRAASWGATLPAETAQTILSRAASFPAACALCDRWAVVSQTEGTPAPAQWLDEIAPPRAASTTREEIVRRAKDLVARHYGIRAALLDRPSKHPSALLARRIAMYLVYRAAALPLADLGKSFGLKSHSSAGRALQQIRADRDRDVGIEVTLDGLLAEL